MSIVNSDSLPFASVNFQGSDMIQRKIPEHLIHQLIYDELNQNVLETKSIFRSLSTIVNRYTANPLLLQEKLTKKYGHKYGQNIDFNNLSQALINFRNLSSGKINYVLIKNILKYFNLYNWSTINDILVGLRLYEQGNEDEAIKHMGFYDFIETIQQDGFDPEEILEQKNFKSIIQKILSEVKE